MKVPERKEREREKLFKEIIPENFPCFVKYMDIGIQEAQPTSDLINSKRFLLEHNIIKSLRARERENFESSKRQVTCHLQENPKGNTGRFLNRHFTGRVSGVIYSKYWKKKIQLRIFYLSKLSFRNKREINTFLNNQNLRKFNNTRPAKKY